jgi:biopolymer transport protein ExbD
MGAMAPQKKGPRASINVTPLVDVVLVLLIIFMLVAPVLNERLATVPAAQRPAATPPDEPRIVVEVQGPDGLVLNGRAVSLRELEAAIEAELGDGADRPVFFRIDDSVRVRDAVAAMDAARGAGARTLATVISP